MHELHSIQGLEKGGAAEATPPCYESPQAGKSSQLCLVYELGDTIYWSLS